MDFLVVNDDGIDSPMLPPLVQQLTQLGEVMVTVPAREQSWRGKAITRYGKISVQQHQGLGAPTYVIDGTPSDCVNIALYDLVQQRPRWVISGVNIGANIGNAYIVNSGTVGAALEAALQGVPAVAFSQWLPKGRFGEWFAHRRLDHPQSQRLIELATKHAAALMQRIVVRGLPKEALLYNINFPQNCREDSQAHWASLVDVRYGRLFRRTEKRDDGFAGDHYERAPFEENLVEADPLSDRSQLLEGRISISALTLPLADVTAKVGEIGGVAFPEEDAPKSSGEATSGKTVRPASA